MTDNMFQDLIPQQQIQRQNMFADLVPQKNNGIVSNIGDDLDNRVSSIAKNPQLSHIIGQGYGFASDVAGEATNALTPDSYVNAAHSTADSIDSTSIGKKMGDLLISGKDAAQSFSDNNPKITQALSDAGNVASWLGGTGSASKIEGAGAKLGLGDAIYNSGKDAQDVAHQEYVGGLILPKETPTVKSDNAMRTIQVDGKNIYQPTPDEIEMAKTVAAIPDVSKKNSVQANLSAIVSARKQEANTLQSTLEKNNVPVDLGTIQNGINQSMTVLADHPHVTGDGKTAALNTVKIMNKAILDNASPDGTISAANLLKARKDFDQALPPRVFTSPSDTPVTVAAKQMRSMVNAIIANADPSAEVAASLRKQSLLYEAADNVAPKAAGEAATKLGRALQKVTPHSLTGTVAGAAGLGAAAEILPHVPLSLAVPAVAGYGIYKGAIAPATRIALGKALGVSNVP